ncbi:MAG: suppressor of glycerol defect [Bogoriella megaspora]|nr:MAG: suppressor of glycerol defect [Bogoriella megaspora]
MAKSYNGPNLPKQLLDQIGHATSLRRERGGFTAAARKDKRKARRVEEKRAKSSSRAKIYVNSSSKVGSQTFQGRGTEELPGSEPSSELLEPTEQFGSERLVRAGSQQQEREHEPGWDSSSDDKAPLVPKLSRSVRDKLAQDDAEIAALEKKLGLKGKRGASKTSQDDGLDGLMIGLDDETDSYTTHGSKKRSREDDDWLQRKRHRGMEDLRNGERHLHNSEFDGDDFAGIENEDDFGLELVSSVDSSLDESEIQDRYDDSEDDNSVFSGFSSKGEHEVKHSVRTRENPYIAPVSASLAPTPKYVPPSLRAAPASDAETLQRLRRQAQGLLNKLSEANVLSIVRDFEQLYQTNARQPVSSVLINLLVGLLCDPAPLDDTFIILHAGFLSAIYTTIGTDFGGQLLERFVQDFDQQYEAAKVSEAAGKQTANLISLLAQLYNFQVLGSTLVYDYIRLFLQDLSELDTELLLRIVKSSGLQLRQDDPSSLKDIVLLLQRSVAATGEANLSVRSKFMIETITNLKNNRVKTGAAASALAQEHSSRMRKTLGTLKTRSIKAREPLRVGLADIRDSEKKGKWWLVGASWNNPFNAVNSKNDTPAKSKGPTAPHSATPDPEDPASTDLNSLATRLRINNPLRRSIFLAILSAADARDASIRLQNLRLKRSQQEEIPRVLFLCAGAEGTYNPYYALVAQRVCGDAGWSSGKGFGISNKVGMEKWIEGGLDIGVDDGEEGGKGAGKRMRFAFAKAVWDTWRGMGEGGDAERDDEDEEEGSGDMDMRKIVNLAKMVGSLVVDGVLDITILKTLNIPYLHPKTRTFLEVMLTTVILRPKAILTHSESREQASVLAIFTKAGDNPELAGGLQYFLRTVIAKSDIVGSKKEKKIVKSECEAIQAKLSSFITGAATGEVGGLSEEDDD